MHMTSRFVIGLLLSLSFVSYGFAQDIREPNSRPQTLTVTAFASAERVRFTAPSSVVQMHLEVYSENAVKLFDFELKGGNVLDWHLQNGQAEQITQGSYLCVLTVKDLSGKLTQRIGTINISDQLPTVEPVQPSKLNPQLAQAVGPMEADSSLTVLRDEEPPTPTVIAHDGEDGLIVRGRGALSFRLGDFFRGKATEQMRLTADGNLGIGVLNPQARLDVAGRIRASEGIIFPDGSIQFSAASKTLGAKSARTGQIIDDKLEFQPQASGTGTQNFIAKWTDNAGTLGDSIISEVGGSIGINGTPNPIFKLDVTGHNRFRGSNVSFYLTGVKPGGNEWLFQTVDADGRLRIFDSTSGAERFSVTQGGRVGIGNPAPNAKLYVEAAEAFGIFGHNTASNSIGVFGQSLGLDGTGVLGRYDGPASNSGWGVFGFSPNGFAGVFGSGNKNGVFGLSSSPLDSGVFGKNDDRGYGVFGSSNLGDGVFGTSNKNGVHGRTASPGDSAVWGENTATGFGVAGTSAGGTGVLGTSSTGVGVHGRSDNGNDGVRGEARVANRAGVSGLTNHALGFGGYFENSAGGRALQVTGNAAQSRDGGGVVKAMAYIDPLDPGTNKILRCYNSQTTGSAVSTPPCGFSFTASSLFPGIYTVDFGFKVDDRFLSVTLVDDSCCRGVVAKITNVFGNIAAVIVRYSDNSDLTHSSFFVIVY